MCFDFLYNFCLKHLSFSEEMNEIGSKMYTGLHVKYPLFLSDFNVTWFYSTDFRKIFTYQILWKSVQWERSCSMRTDGQTDITKLIAAFCNFAKVSKKLYCIHKFYYKDKCVTTYLGYLSLRPRIEPGHSGILSRTADHFCATVAVASGPIQTWSRGHGLTLFLIQLQTLYGERLAAPRDVQQQYVQRSEHDWTGHLSTAVCKWQYCHHTARYKLIP